jgi:hypothetical protein
MEGEASLNCRRVEVCLARQLEIRKQELRTFVVKRSVSHIHFVLGFVMLMTIAGLLAPSRFHDLAGLLTALISLAGVVIAASTRSTGRAIELGRSDIPMSAGKCRPPAEK